MHISTNNEKGSKTMKLFENPDIELIKLSAVDVIATSGEGENEFPEIIL